MATIALKIVFKLKRFSHKIRPPAHTGYEVTSQATRLVHERRYTASVCLYLWEVLTRREEERERERERERENKGGRVTEDAK